MTMKPIQAIKNQYTGINDHLHSLWQAEGGWDEFHAAHIIYLANALKIPLLPMLCVLAPMWKPARFLCQR